MKVIISGGGTGGHIYPAIAIADAIMENWPEAEIRFVGAEGRMEMEKVPRAGYEIDGLWISGFQRKSSLKNLLLPAKVVHSLWKSRSIIRQFKPDLAIGVGGYASGPMLYMASAMNVPSMIQEQNSFPGITNKLLAGRVDKICVAFEGMDRFFDRNKIVLTGNPVRSLDLPMERRQEAYDHFGLDPSKFTVLLVGGSLGSLTINRAMETAAQQIGENVDKLQFIWQIGDHYYDRFVKMETARSSNVKPVRFVERMDLAYLAADLVICRAGALTLSEIAICGKAAVLVPSPNVSEDHQTKNAQALVDDGAALMIKDDQLVTRLMAVVQELSRDSETVEGLRRSILKLARPNATKEIIDVIKNLVR